MREFSKSLTAKELMDELGKDSEYLAMAAEQERKRVEVSARLARAEAPLVEDLRKVNIKVNSAWDLVNTPLYYGPAVPVLVKHLRGAYPGVILEGIGRALGVSYARPYWRELVDLYRLAPEHDPYDEEGLPKGTLKMGLAIALSAMADKPELAEVVSILKDSAFGPTRDAFVFSLTRRRDASTKELLSRLAVDPELDPSIRQAVADVLAERERRRSRRSS